MAQIADPRRIPPAFLAACLLGAGALALLVSAAPARTVGGEIAFSPCRIGDGGMRIPAECARVEVALDPFADGTEADPDATLSLAIARLPARRDTADNVPFTMIAGGPGQSAIESWPGVAHAFRHIARDRDVILVDQRGTGDSSRLDCPSEDASVDEELDAALASTPEEIARHARDCLAALELDPRSFTTSVAVRDLDAVRARLGIERWNLYGVSYGTRVAQHYARRFPERVRTLILDAVVPPDVPLGPDIAPFADRAVELVFARCAASLDCRERFPDIGPRTRAWLTELEATPLEIEHEDLVSGERRRTRFTARHLASLLRLMAYNAQTAALLPSMLDAAIEEGNVAPLARQTELQGEALGQSLAGGMHNAVVCSEDVPFLEPGAEQASRGTYLGTLPVESLRASCAEWPAGIRDADFGEPLAVDVPTLILSGEADPVTPPAYGERVVAALPNARHLVNPGQGHMQAPLGCLPALMGRFVASAEPTSVDAACLERLTPPPFFVDANGPMP